MKITTVSLPYRLIERLKELLKLENNSKSEYVSKSETYRTAIRNYLKKQITEMKTILKHEMGLDDNSIIFKDIMNEYKPFKIIKKLENKNQKKENPSKNPFWNHVTIFQSCENSDIYHIPNVGTFDITKIKFLD